MKDYDEADKYYDKALGLEPNHVRWYYKARLYYDLGRYEEAISYFDEAINLCENYRRAWNYKAKAFKKLGKVDEAQKCFNKAQQMRK